MPANNLISGSERLKELLEWKDIKLDASFFTAGRENIAMQLKKDPQTQLTPLAQQTYDEYSKQFMKQGERNE